MELFWNENGATLDAPITRNHYFMKWKMKWNFYEMKNEKKWFFYEMKNEMIWIEYKNVNNMKWSFILMHSVKMKMSTVAQQPISSITVKLGGTTLNLVEWHEWTRFKVSRQFPIWFRAWCLGVRQKGSSINLQWVLFWWIHCYSWNRGTKISNWVCWGYLSIGKWWVDASQGQTR